ncbi:MAG TPA: PepSY-associated TM helix domain-containing protein [Dongiaceae bacterium]|nr:PepSY-associated TM helix domain-containing protein [Dongiaceae bacterium]
MSRRYLVLFHRYVGLVMAGFLLIAGVTGALLAWNDELEMALSPGMMRVQPPADPATPMLSPLALREKALALYPQAVANFVLLNQAADKAAVLYIDGALDPATGEAAELPNDEIYLNPYTGELQGERRWGDIAQGSKNLMPFIYRLHYQLALGTVGTYAFGIIALLWTLDCFVAVWLTTPARQRANAKNRDKTRKSRVTQRSWWSRWWPSWKVRWNGGNFKLNYDLHRAGGLWPWAMLFVLAWSSVAFNLRDVYNPVMRTLFPMQTAIEPVPAGVKPKPIPEMSWEQGLTTGRSLMAALAKEKDFAILHEQSISYDPNRGAFRYRVKSDRDIREHGGSTQITFDATTGALKHLYLPTGEAAGDTVTNWLYTLHMANIWGVPFKIFVCVVGIAVAVLSGTGVYIWWRKRAGRVKLSLQNAQKQKVKKARGEEGNQDEDSAGAAPEISS